MKRYSHPHCIQSITKTPYGFSILAVHRPEEHNFYYEEYICSSWEQGLEVFSFSECNANDKEFIFLGLDSWQMNHEIPGLLGIADEVLLQLKSFNPLWFPVAQICSRYTEALELLHHNPALLWFVCYGFIFNHELRRHFDLYKENHGKALYYHNSIDDIPPYSSAMDNLFCLNEKQILQQLCHVDNDDAIAVLRKNKLDLPSGDIFIATLQIIHNPELLQHLKKWPVININILGAFANEPELIKLKIFSQNFECFSYCNEFESIPLTEYQQFLNKGFSATMPVTPWHLAMKYLDTLCHVISDIKYLANKMECADSTLHKIRNTKSLRRIFQYHATLIKRFNGNLNSWLDYYSIEHKKESV